jgi:hypothetical protein
MAEITAQDVKALRDATGAGMKDAKNALVEADGDRDKAAQILRQKGLSKVATLEDRENNQGTVAIAHQGNVAAMVQLKSETDFAGWRAAARRLRRAGTPPDQVAWMVTTDAVLLEDGALPPAPATSRPRWRWAASSARP